jgi:hypothetical protein
MGYFIRILQENYHEILPHVFYLFVYATSMVALSNARASAIG